MPTVSEMIGMLVVGLLMLALMLACLRLGGTSTVHRRNYTEE